jgi:hypothetical protein
MTDRKSRAGNVPDERSVAFYTNVLEHLISHRVPFLVGGAYAFRHYTGIDRITRDFDVFLKPEDAEPTLERLRQDGFAAGMVFPHWLAKVRHVEDYVDLIFSSGNAVARVDDQWFERAVGGEVFGVPVQFVAPEEIIWSKGFIMERERFDGADILHLIHDLRGKLDWNYLRERFGAHGRVLLAHLVLFGYVYPSDRDLVPAALMRALFEDAMKDETRDGPVCLGTLLSRSQYLPDLDRGLRDGRLAPRGNMTADEIAIWTDAADVPPPKG